MCWRFHKLASRRFLATLAFCATFFALGVVALGAFTRLIDAGLGCPDWPGCYGHILVPANDQAPQMIAYKAWAEMIHRYFVGALSLFILSIVMIIFSKNVYRLRSNIVFAISLILLLAYQIMLGQWTVTLKLLPVIVSQHLLGGFFILSILWLIFLNNRNAYATSHTGNSSGSSFRFFSILAIFGLLLLLAQIALGAWTSTNYASFSCPDFPFCKINQVMQFQFKEAFNLFSPIGMNYEGGVLSESARQTIQMIHRIGALILTTYLFIFSVVVITQIKKPAILKPVYVVLALLLVQVCLGISNVMFKLPLVTAIAHNLTAALLLLAMITFIYQLVTE